MIAHRRRSLMSTIALVLLIYIVTAAQHMSTKSKRKSYKHNIINIINEILFHKRSFKQ